MTKPINTPLNSISKPPNYSDEQVTELRERYLKNPCRDTVNEIAADFGKRQRSVIAKLSREGIYVTPPRTTKSGTPIVKKETLVERIEKRLEIEVPSLVKTNKLDLEKITAALDEWLGEVDIEEA